MTSLIYWLGRVCRLRTSFFVCAAPLLLATLATCGSTVEAANSERWERTPRSHFVDVVKESCKSVVSIQGEKQYEVDKRSGRGNQYDVFNGMGTGVVIDERGYILTNYHVVKGLLKLEVLTSDGESYRDVELIRNDVATDLAILKIKPKRPLVPMRMGSVDRLELAEDVFAIGNPYGYHSSITRGVVSCLDRPLEVNEWLFYDRVIQTDAAINPGNSGGPLINVDGEMVGLNAAVREEAENIAFAIPIDVVTDVAERMLRQTVAKMTHHGMKLRVVSSDMPDYPSDGNGEDMLLVESVDPHSPAENAGIESGDFILSSNGRSLHCSLDFTCSLIDVGMNDKLDLNVERNGETATTAIAFNEKGKKNKKTLLAKKGSIKAVDVSENQEEKSNGKLSLAKTEETYTESVVETSATEEKEEAEETEKAPKSGSKAARCVWNILGLETTNVSAEEYAERFPTLQAVSIGAFNFAPNGGVNVERVDPRGLLSLGAVKLQKDDFIFGFGVGSEKENQLGITSLENLYYIAQRLSEFAKIDSGKARVYLIRGNKPYFLEVNLSVAED